MRKAFSACVIASMALLMGCGAMLTPPARNSYRAPQPSTCNALFPRGLAGGTPFAVTRFSVVFRITASYTFKDPSLAHEAIPRAFIADMNAVNPSVQYFLADGTNGNLTIDLNVNQDATADHYGMSTQVWGPSSFNFNSAGTTVSTVSYFIFSKQALYVTGDKLISDAATQATGYLNGGWTCNGR